MGVHEDIRMALLDAIGWQAGLAEAWAPGTPERAEALAQIRRYRGILKRRYGSARTSLDEMIAEATPLTLDELRKLRTTDGQ